MKAKTRDIDGGWAWVILVCGVGILFISGSLVYSMGIINSAMLDVFDGDVSWTSVVVATTVGVLNSVGPIAGLFINKFGCRPCAIVGGIISTIGLAGASFSKNLYSVMLTLGVLTGFGYGFSYIAATVKIGHNFHRMRPLASGIVAAGAGLGMFVGPPVMQFLIDHYGLHGSFLIMAGISSHTCVLGSLFRPLPVRDVSKKTSSKEAFKERRFKSSVTFWCEKIRKEVRHSLHIFKNVGFMMYLWCTFCWSLAESACFLHLPTYCVEQGTSKTDTAFIFTIMGAVNICSRIMIGFTANDERISKLILLFGQMTIAGVCTGLFPLYSRSYGGQVAFAAVLGLYSSSASSLMSPLAVELVGLDDLATAYGLISLAFGAGSLVGPPIAGAIVDYGGTYSEAFIVAAIVYIMSGLSAILIPLVSPAKDDHVTDGLRRDLSVSVRVLNEETPFMIETKNKNETN